MGDHHDNMFRVMNTPLHPNCETGVTGVYLFLIFAMKHRLWVLIRTASRYVFSKNKKSIKMFNLKINIFTVVQYCCILHGRVCVMLIQIQ